MSECSVGCGGFDGGGGCSEGNCGGLEAGGGC